jgi:hypothetical protein
MATQTSGSSGGSFDPISSGVQAAGSIVQAIAGISDANQRRLIESNLSLLDEKQQIALARELANKKNKNEQVAFLINTVMAARNANADRLQRADTVKWILIGSAFVITLGIVAWVYKKK